MKQHLFPAFLCFFSATAAFSQKTIAVKQTTSTTASVNNKTVFGKYGCSASKYNGSNYEFLPKGSFVINPNGTYVYNGFEKPSTGTFTIDAATGVLHFNGGYFKGGEATPMQGRPNRYYVVFPANPDHRWTCSLIEKKK